MRIVHEEETDGRFKKVREAVVRKRNRFKTL